MQMTCKGTTQGALEKSLDVSECPQNEGIEAGSSLQSTPALNLNYGHYYAICLCWEGRLWRAELPRSSISCLFTDP